MHAGIDVSKNWVDAALAESGERLERTSPLKAAKWLKKRGATLVALEATGGYELPMIHALNREKIAVARINPCQARRFAQALGQRSKTDRADAAMLARYAQTVRPQPVSLPAQALLTLRAFVLRRRELVAMRTAERNRLAMASDAWLAGHIEAMLAHLAVQIAAMDKAILNHLAAHPELEAVRKRLTTMPGVGPVTAAMLIACMPELGRAKRGEIAALAGLAPFTRESGQWKGKAFCTGGRAQVRECLYMAAVSAIRGDNAFASTYKALTQRGKPHKVAVIAVMRKMIVTLNAMLAQKIDFKP